MNAAPKLAIRQTQRLTMTPQVRQSLAVLRMGQADLDAHVDEAVRDNPFLERAPRGEGGGPAHGAYGGDDWSLAERVMAETTLAAHLERQIGQMRAAEPVQRLAAALAHDVDEDGYLRAPDAELAARYGATEAEATAARALIRACEPAGVGARDLADCLLAQLEEADRADPAMRALIANLPLLAKGARAELAALCGVAAEELPAMAAELRALSPKPGACIGASREVMVAPDIAVLPAATGGWRVELTSEAVPRVLLDRSYAAEIGEGAAPEVRAFVAERRRAADWLMRCLEQRAETMLKVASEIVRRQSLFFEDGPSALRPMGLRDVAEATGLHVSTISRAIASKHLISPRGVAGLHAFFSASVPAADGGEARSAAAVRARLRELIREEPPGRPRSDDALRALLQAEGVALARRTVAKYREAMRIPASSARRRAAADCRGGGDRAG